MSGVSKPAILPQNSAATLVGRRVVIGTLVVVCIALWFANVGYRSLAEPDEGRYAEIPREMLASGDWITPHLNDIPYLEKPPLQYWATAFAYRVFGFDPWVSRLWATTLGLLGVAAAYATGRVLWGARAGVFAALILASSPLYFVVAHINTLDIGLAFFMNAALACLFFAQHQTTDPTARRRWMWLCWLALACGFLQKGLVTVALPAVTLAVYCIAYRDSRLWRQLHLLDGLVILAVVTLPWLVLVANRNPGFLEFFFIHEHVARFATTVHRRSEPWWFFIAILSVGVLPWIPVIVQAISNYRREYQRGSGLHAEGLLLIWAAALLVFFSFSGSKLAPYIVPAVSPLALLAGRWLQLHASVRSLRPVVIVSAVFCVLLVCLSPLMAHFVEPGPKQTAYLEIAGWAWIAGLIGLVGVAAALAAIRYRQLLPAVCALSGGFIVTLTLLMCGSNALEALRARPGLAGVIAPHLTMDTPLYCVGMYWQTLPFALQRSCSLVEYTGELETQFDQERRHWLPDVASFVEQWKREPSAVAVVNPALWS